MPVCVNVSPTTNVARLNEAIEDRARELGLTYNEVARRAGFSTQTLSDLRGKGKQHRPDRRPKDSTLRGVDTALEWPIGTALAYWDGRKGPAGDADPTIAEIEATRLTREQKNILISVYRNQRAAAATGILEQARELEEKKQQRGA